MSTTTIFIEHLISGALTLLAILFGVAATGIIQLTDVRTILELESFSAILGIAFAYPLGIFIDNVADKILESPDSKMRNKSGLKKGATARLMMISKGSSLANFMNYRRTRIRIARSSAVNFAFLTLCVVTFLIARRSEIGSITNMTVGVVLIGGLALTLFALYSWYEISRNYHDRTAEFIKLDSEIEEVN